MFVMECLAHVLENFWKAGVMDVKYDNGQVDTDATRKNTQLYITWTNKSQKGEKSLEVA